MRRWRERRARRAAQQRYAADAAWCLANGYVADARAAARAWLALEGE